MHHGKLTQIIAGFLILLTAAASTAQTQSKISTEAFASLLKLAKERDKVLTKQWKQLDKRYLDLLTDISKARNKGRRAEAVAIGREGTAIQITKDSIERELEVTQIIIKLAKQGDSDYDRNFDRAWSTANHAGRLKRFNDEASRQGIEARVRLETAQAKGADAKEIELMRREVAAYQQAFAALDREEEFLNQYLALFGNTSVSEIQKNQEAAVEAERAKYRRWERERERAREVTAQLIVAVGTVAALVQILKSPDSTPAEINYAQQMMKDLNDQARTACHFRGGMYVGGGPFTIGTCTK